jgi:hypothetical protein
LEVELETGTEDFDGLLVELIAEVDE